MKRGIMGQREGAVREREIELGEREVGERNGEREAGEREGEREW